MARLSKEWRRPKGQRECCLDGARECRDGTELRCNRDKFAYLNIGTVRGGRPKKREGKPEEVAGQGEWSSREWAQRKEGKEGSKKGKVNYGNQKSSADRDGMCIMKVRTRVSKRRT